MKIKYALALVCSLFAITACGNNNSETNMKTNGNPVAVVQTTMGDIEVELFTDKTPITAGNFVELAKAGKYDGVSFHRVIDGFMIQTGDYENGDGTGGQAAAGGNFDDEIAEGLSNVVGTLSMANRGVIAGKGTNGSQFFINQVDNTYLDGRHSVFGKVIEGMDIVNAIAKVEADGRNKPLEPVLMEKVTIKE